MSEKAAKQARKEEASGKILYTILIEVHNDGGYAMEVPKGASMPLTCDVLMRASHKVYTTFVEALNKQQAAKTLVKPVGGIPEGLLRRSPA